MDRYFEIISKFFFTLLMLAGMILTNLDAKAEDLSFSTQEEDQAQARQLYSFTELFRDKVDQTYRGVIMGNILSVDPQHRFLYIKSTERDLPRIFVYTDKKTVFTKSDVGFRRRVRHQTAIEGGRVAARVFIKQGVVLADEVFLVQEDFEPPSRYEKKKFAARSAAAPAAGEEKKAEGGGGHH